MGRNPKQSKWYSTPQAERHRRQIALTLSPEALEALDDIASAGQPSAFVERLILQERERRSK